MVGILLIATRKYKQFLRPLLEQIDKFFLPKEHLTVFLFTDEEYLHREEKYDFEIKQFQIAPLQFPEATLLRYRIFSNHSQEMKECSHLFYLDVDSKLVDVVGTEVLGEGLTVTHHPGFYGLGGWGSQNVNPSSNAFLAKEHWTRYFAGGFQGGKREEFIQMCDVLAARIDDDEKRGVRAEHNDESHLQWYLWQHPEVPRIELHSGYTMVESPYLRQNWKIDHLPVKIVALDKNHADIRS
jgi:histo-blood group ABO system transferase